MPAENSSSEFSRSLRRPALKPEEPWGLWSLLETGGEWAGRRGSTQIQEAVSQWSNLCPLLLVALETTSPKHGHLLWWTPNGSGPLPIKRCSRPLNPSRLFHNRFLAHTCVLGAPGHAPVSTSCDPGHCVHLLRQPYPGSTACVPSKPSTPLIVLEAGHLISQCAGGRVVCKWTVAIILDQCESSCFSPLSGGDGRVWKTQGLC